MKNVKSKKYKFPMIIDLSEWNEYIADDVPPGPIPENVPLEIMQVVTSEAISKKDEDLPSSLELLDRKNLPKVRLFWRLKQ